jgi:hypothetical protein
MTSIAFFVTLAVVVLVANGLAAAELNVEADKENVVGGDFDNQPLAAFERVNANPKA